MKYILAFIIYGCICFSCDDPETVDNVSPTSSVHKLFEDYHEFKLEINPIEATKGGYSKYDNRVVDYISDVHQEYLMSSYSNFLSTAGKIDQSQLSSEDQLSLKVLEWDSRIKLEGLNNHLATIASPMYDLPTFELMPITQITSLQLYFSQLAGGTSVHPFKTPQDYNNWLERVDEYLIWLDTAILKMREGLAQGVALPKILIERVMDQLRPFAIKAVKDHLFYQPIIHMPDHFTTIDRDPLEDAFTLLIEDKVKPKYNELLQFMSEEYLPQGRDTDGLSALPQGRETYNYLIRLHTSTDMSAEEIFELGTTEVSRIEQEMRTVKDQLGYKGDLRSFFDHIRSNPDLMPFKAAEEVVDNFNLIRSRLNAGVNQLFDLTPKADFVVRRTESFREQSASAEYVPGSKDATRPGTFYIPLPDVEQHNVLMDEALFLHEAIPGHHFQLSLQQENESLPAFLHAEGMGVFVEGWALYAESLGRELGIYTDPYQYFGMLSMEMHRAIRLVVDAGIHAKGWSREQAIQYSLDHEADSVESITSEIERYMATPGQALSYKIGQLKIRSLRTKAETELGAQFDIKEFHNQVLNSGSLPMSLLEDKIDNWIKVQLKNNTKK